MGIFYAIAWLKWREKRKQESKKEKNQETSADVQLESVPTEASTE